MDNKVKTLALAYLDAVGRKDYATVERLLAPDVRFTGPTRSRSSAEEFIGALKRLGAIHVRNEPTRVFVDGDDVCVIYDFVTDTAAGAVPTVEWLRVDGGRVASVHLFFDRVSFKPASEEVARRVAK